MARALDLTWSRLGLSISFVWAQLPARYLLKGDALSFLWREYRITGEYRLFRWAPPFISSVERARWDGLTFIAGGSYYRRLPLRGGIFRSGLRYYWLRRVYAPQGVWAGLHLCIGGWGPPREKTTWAGGVGFTMGYQHLFYQAYGGVVEPYLQVEGLFGRYRALYPIQVGLNVGFAARKWDRRNLH
ncbi:MAG: hypothetical protein N2170_03375 [Bacteroidia bacterium]|nr:hypothetical protein [Bacteroidia bacterium]